MTFWKTSKIHEAFQTLYESCYWPGSSLFATYNRSTSSSAKGRKQTPQAQPSRCLCEHEEHALHSRTSFGNYHLCQSPEKEEEAKNRINRQD